MLNAIEAVSNRGEILTLPLDDSSTGLLLQGEPGGLGPVKATIISSSFATIDGTQYQSSQREDRNITFQLALEPDWAADEDVADLRDRAYEFFMPKAMVGLKFYDTKKTDRWISGIVESCEPSMFTDAPVLDVSIICNNPDFFDPIPVHKTGNTTALANDTIIPYPGTVEAGVLFVLSPNRTLTSFTVHHVAEDGTEGIMQFDGDLINGDTLTISTVRGNKYVTRRRAGVDVSLLGAISPQSNWIEMRQGDNKFRVDAAGAAIPWTLDYTVKYGGL